MKAAGVTVIVPVWNRSDLLQQLLANLREQTHPIAEVLVIDNGSQDNSAEIGEQHGARVVRMGRNTGFSRAVNRGIQESRTEWLAIVNNDVELARDWLERLMETAQRLQIWFATGKLLNASRRDQIDGTYDLLCRGACAWRAGHGRQDGPEFSTGRVIRFAPATAALYRSDLFHKVGLLDESFESYLEDVDFGLRCASLNYAGRYVPEAIAYHMGSATLGPWHADTVRRISRNQVLLIAKHYPYRLLLRYGWSILVAQALWGILAVRHRAGWQFLRGKLAGLLSFGPVRRANRERIFRPAQLSRILDDAEREIHHIQRRTGLDLYWRLYFLLTAGGAN